MLEGLGERRRTVKKAQAIAREGRERRLGGFASVFTEMTRIEWRVSREGHCESLC